ncbi:hypothetical protein SAMN05421538_1038 [Paracoccus isoporae]|uniref:Rod binding protein n=1 Tax=Paracoccus isoporae TaxID=591205 RepID=A0A1G6YKB9_9RHOB|nr:hypothetical protein [Paracoccus isoporae]SDD90839.1 hypothetical protein SAMN05421538_1038 [Paracoccus isoporae]
MRIDTQTGLPSPPAPKSPRLEQVFLEEMLTHMMPKAGGALASGTGESAFASFLRREYAAALAARVDLGLQAGRDG